MPTRELTSRRRGAKLASGKRKTRSRATKMLSRISKFSTAVIAVLLVCGAAAAEPPRGPADHDLGEAKVMDRVIQNNQPMFMVVWVGSAVAVVASTVLGLWQVDGAGRLLIIFAALAYLLGVQLPTVTINIPLNNKLQTLDVDAMNATTQQAARQDFEPRWNQWNSIRTAFASLASALLLILLSHRDAEKPEKRSMTQQWSWENEHFATFYPTHIIQGGIYEEIASEGFTRYCRWTYSEKCASGEISS